MAVALRSSTTSGVTDSSGTSRVIAVPAGAAVDDVAVLILEQWEAGNPTVTYPAGFTEKINAISGQQKTKLAWKRLTAGDTGNYTMSWTGSQFNQAHCLMISGAIATGDPFEATNTANGTSTTIPSTSVTIATLAFLIHVYSNENSSTSTPPTNFTEQHESNYLKTNYRIPGATGTYTATGGTQSTSTLAVVALAAIMPAAGGAIDLAPAGATQAQSAEAPTLTQVHVLAVAAATQAQTSDAPTLTQVHVLTVDGASQQQAATTPALTQAHSLAVEAAMQAQTAGNVTLTQVHTLVVDAAVQAQASDVVTLAVGGISLVVAEAVQAQSAESMTLTQLHILTVDPAVQLQQAEQVTLLQTHTLVVASAMQAQTATMVELTVAGAARDLTLVGAVEPNHWTASIEPDRWVTEIEPNRWEGTVPWPEL